MPKEGETGARLVNGDLELVFEWREDRFAHKITTRAASSPTAAVVTLESSTAPDYETPVFQEVHQQGDLVFASGMSGSHHWSASVEPIESGFLFDVACRVKAEVDASAIAYVGTAEIVLATPEGTATQPDSTGTQRLAMDRPLGDPPYTLRCRYEIKRA